jgi:FAD/FMN-containing dehydrogenase
MLRSVFGRASSVIHQALERASFPRPAAGSPTQPAGLVGAMTTSGVGRGLGQAIRGRVFLPGQPGFRSAAHVFNTRFDAVFPLAVARPVDTRDVRDAVRFTVSHGVQVRARSGGHSYAGYSTLADGVVIDLRRLNGVTVDQPNRTATIGAGSQLIDVSSALARKGATIPAGSCPSVGIAGVALGGGFGLTGRALGLTLDNLLAVQMVTADGQLRTVDDHADPDLFWAVRGGGGGNFGIVTDFVFRTHPLPKSATYFEVQWPWSSASQAIEVWQQWAPHARDEVTGILHLNAGTQPSIATNGQFLGASRLIPGLLKTLLDVPGARLATNVEKSYFTLQLILAGCSQIGAAACHTIGTSPRGKLPRESFNAKSDYVSEPLTADGRAAVIAATENPGAGSLLCDAYGGAINRVTPDATAFIHRDPLFCIQYYGAGASTAWIDQASIKMHPHVSGMAYQNYIDPTLEGWQHAYYGPNLARLEATRKRVDPDHYFNFPQAIGR